MRGRVPGGRFLLRVAREAAWAPLAVVVAHHFAARRFGHEPYVDTVMHFSGGAACAFFFRRSARIGSVYLGTLTPLALDLLAFGLACAAALAWEFLELLSDVFRHTTIQITAVDTLRDLALGVAGAIVHLVAARLLRRRSVGDSG